MAWSMWTLSTASSNAFGVLGRHGSRAVRSLRERIIAGDLGQMTYLCRHLRNIRLSPCANLPMPSM
jgi:hypothetical protein